MVASKLLMWSAMTDHTLTPHHRLLVVDDEPTVLAAIAEYLTAYQFAVDTAREREEAEAMVLVYGYDLVLTDMRLTGAHGREGLELLRFVREHQPEARVVLLTAHGSRELEEEARAHGADEFLGKPLPLSELAAEIFTQLEFKGTPGREFWSRSGAR